MDIDYIDAIDRINRSKEVESALNHLADSNNIELDHDDIFKNDISTSFSATKQSYFDDSYYEDSKFDDSTVNVLNSSFEAGTGKSKQRQHSSPSSASSYADEHGLEELAKLRERYDLKDIYAAYYLCESDNRGILLYFI